MTLHLLNIDSNEVMKRQMANLSVDGSSALL